MSKPFGKSRRAPEKGDNNDKRPSVFERLGVRSRETSSSSSYPPPPVDNYSHSQAPRRLERDCSPPPQSMKSSHHYSSGGKDGRSRLESSSGSKLKAGRGHSPSFSPPPKNRKYEEPSTSSYGGKFSKTKDALGSGNVRHTPKKASKEMMAKHSKSLKESKLSSSKLAKDKKVAKVVKKRPEKKRKKDRSSSASSGGSTDGSVSSSSSVSTTSTSTTSSNNSTSSESSVPSVKLKSEKVKPKKKKGKVDKKVIIPKPKPKAPSSSRSSSSVGGEVEAKRISSFDLREKLNARSPSIREGSMKDQFRQKDIKARRMDPVPMKKQYDRIIPEEDRYPPKKRPAVQEPYVQEEVKRRRMLSPPTIEKYRQQHEPSLHNVPRRAPPQTHEIPKRPRSPAFHDMPKVPHPHPHAHSPMRGGRPRDPRVVEEVRRPDFRNEIDKRNMAYNPNIKPRDSREQERFRDAGPGPGPGHSDFGRDNQRPRERLAPLRPPIDNRQDRERDREPIPDFQRRPRAPPFMQPDSNRGRGGGHQGPSFRPPPQQQQHYMDKDRGRFNMGGSGGGQSERAPLPDMGNKRHFPLIPKSKEALAERYEMMRKSGYVDKWVNETVKTVKPVTPRASHSRSETIRKPSPQPPKVVATISDEKVVTTTKEEIPPKSKEVVEKLVIEAEDLSDFSDDADEILNNEQSIKESTVVAIEAPSVSGEVENTQNPGEISKVLTTPVETPVTATVPVYSSTPLEKAPSVKSQDRLALKHPFVRDGRSLPSQSQTDDDILETMDFEEISEDELGEVENKINIVDALGVDWSSLVCQEKKEPKAVGIGSSSVKKRWNPVSILSRLGLSRELAGEEIYNKFLEKKALYDDESTINSLNADGSVKKREIKDIEVIERIGLGPNSRALSSRRDMAVRRHLLGLPPKSLSSMDMLHPTTSNAPPQEMESVSELYKLSISLFKSLRETSPIC